MNEMLVVGSASFLAQDPSCREVYCQSARPEMGNVPAPGRFFEYNLRQIRKIDETLHNKICPRGYIRR